MMQPHNNLETKNHMLPDLPAEDGVFSGLAAVYDRLDQDGDIIAPGAFADSLKAHKPLLLWQHDPASPIGKLVHLDDRADGLHMRAQLALSGKGREAYELLKIGAVAGLSVGFITRESIRDSATGARRITRADLKEISVVSFPAQVHARISEVKSASLLPVAVLEKALRGAGLSRKQAKAVLSGGVKAAYRSGGLSAQSYDQQDLPQIYQQICDARSALAADLGISA